MEIDENFFIEKILPHLDDRGKHNISISTSLKFFNGLFKASKKNPPIRPFMDESFILRNNKIKQLRRWIANGVFLNLIPKIPEIKKDLLIVQNAYKNGVPDFVPPKKEMTCFSLKEKRKRLQSGVTKILPSQKEKVVVSDKWKLAKDLMNLPHDACKYPLKDTFCGVTQKKDSVYCSQHHKLCYEKGNFIKFK